MEKIIAIAQMCSTNDKTANRLQVQEIIETAVKQNACVSTHFQKTSILNTNINYKSIFFFSLCSCQNAVITLEAIAKKQFL